MRFLSFLVNIVDEWFYSLTLNTGSEQFQNINSNHKQEDIYVFMYEDRVIRSKEGTKEEAEPVTPGVTKLSVWLTTVRSTDTLPMGSDSTWQETWHS